jgi:PAS domain S-box-containing protein
MELPLNLTKLTDQLLPDLTRSMIRLNTDGIFVYNDQLEVLIWNEALEKFLQTAQETALGQKVRQVLPATDLPHQQACLEGTLEGKLYRKEPVNYQMGSGASVNALVDYLPILNESGIAVAGMGIVREVTSVREAGQPLQPASNADYQRTERLLSGVLNSSLSGVLALRAVRGNAGAIVDFEYLVVNLAAEKMLGREQKDLVGRHMLKEYPGLREDLFHHYVEVVESGRALSHEMFYEEDGFQNWFNLEAVKYEDGLVASFTDVTARKLAEEKIQHNQFLLHQSQEIGQVGSFDWHIARRELTGTPQLYRMLGYEYPRAINAEMFFSRIHAEDQERVRHVLRNALAQSQEFSVEFRIVKPDQPDISVWAKGKTFCDFAGQPVRMIGAVLDMTEKKGIQDELQRKNEALSVAQEMLTRINVELELRVEERTRELAASEEELRQTLEQAVELNQKIQASENFLSSIIDQSPVSTWISDDQGTQIRVNEACLKLFGVEDASQGLGKYNLFKDELLQQSPFFDDIKAVFTEGKIARFSGDYDLSKVSHVDIPTGVPITLVTTIFPIRDTAGQVTNAVVQHEDITRRKLAQEALLASEERYRFFIQYSSEAIWRFESEAGFVVDIQTPEEEQIQLFYQNVHLAECNDAMARMYGFAAAEEIIGARLGDMLPLSEPTNREYLLHFIRSGYRLVDAESIETDNQGNTKYFLNNLIGFVRDGKLIRVWGSQRDITDRKKAEDALKESENWYRLLAQEQKVALENLSEARRQFQFLSEFIPQIVFRTQANGDHDYFNQRWYEYTGLDFDNSKDESWAHVLHPDDYDRTWQVWRHSLETGAPYEIEYRLRRFDGQFRWFLGRALPMKDEAGNILKWFGTCTDVHDQKTALEEIAEAQQQVSQTNEELNRMNRQLRKINEDLDNFVYTASHDLKAPMANLEGLVTMLGKKLTGRLSGQEQSIINLMLISVNKFNQTIRDLTEITKVQKSMQEEPEMLSIAEALDNVKTDMVHVIDSLDAEIISDFQVKEIRFARKNLRSILYNLVSNALKYRSPHRSPRIHLESERQADWIRLSVHDNGLGIDAEHIPKLFGMFKRLHTHVEGTGIGLYIVKRIVENNGGHIEVQSELGKGTSFNIYLPVFLPYEKNQ